MSKRRSPSPPARGPSSKMAFCRRAGIAVFIVGAVTALVARVVLQMLPKVQAKVIALYQILTIPAEQHQAYLDSYDVYQYYSDEELRRAYGENWKKVEKSKLRDTYATLQYYCQLVGCEKMYVPPAYNLRRSNEENQVIFEYQMASWLNKGQWDQPINKPGRVLDIGCGKGIILREIGNFLGPEVELIGLNFDNGSQLQHAKKQENMTLVDRDMNQLPYDFISDSSLTAAYIFGASTFNSDWDALAKEMARVLKPGSRFVVACDWINFDKLNMSDPEHRRLWTGARRVGAAGRHTRSKEEYVRPFLKYGFTHVHSENYGPRFLDMFWRINVVRQAAEDWMEFFHRFDYLNVLEQPLAMMKRFSGDIAAAVEADDRGLFSFAASHVFEYNPK